MLIGYIPDRMRYTEFIERVSDAAGVAGELGANAFVLGNVLRVDDRPDQLHLILQYHAIPRHAHQRSLSFSQPKYWVSPFG
ncbi:MAG: hypothetical protein WAZ94_08470 [Phycisphaerales bacterium]